MRRLALLILIFAVATFGGRAQTSGDTDQAAATSTIHASARLVIVDVTVTDSHGAPVRGLPSSAFHLTESNHPQVIRGFDEHTAAPVAGAEASVPALQAGVFTNLVALSPQTPPAILLLDALNTPMQSQAWARQKLLDYLRTATPNTRIAICVLNSKLTMLQDLTTDPTLLRSALERVKAQASSTGNADADRAADKSQIPVEARDAFEVSPEWANINEGERADISLQAFHQLALYLAGIPGRKNLIWFSGAFPLDLMPRRRSPYSGSPAWEAEYRQTVDLLTRSRVAIYPVDARGLAPAPLVTSSRSRTATDFADIQIETQSAMVQMADDTGGHAFIDTNGLAQAVKEVVDKGSEYYTLSYTPSDGNAHGEYRDIHVQMDGGYQLGYRRGYFADRDQPEPTTNPVSTVKSAALYNAPPATQIPFYVHVQPPGKPAAAEGVLTPVNQPKTESTARRSLTPDGFLHYEVEFSADPRGLMVSRSADGLRHSHVEYVVLVYDRQGRVVNSSNRALQTTWNDSQFRTVLERGFRYRMEIGVPAGSVHSLRLMVHDLGNDTIGTVDVPSGSLPQPTSVMP